MAKRFYHCKYCGKRMIERLPNGCWKFVFGKDKETAGEPPVHMIIFGSLKMKCLRRSCGKFNTFYFWPKVKFNQSDEIEVEPISSQSEVLAET